MLNAHTNGEHESALRLACTRRMNFRVHSFELLQPARPHESAECTWSVGICGLCSLVRGDGLVDAAAAGREAARVGGEGAVAVAREAVAEVAANNLAELAREAPAGRVAVA